METLYVAIFSLVTHPMSAEKNKELTLDESEAVIHGLSLPLELTSLLIQVLRGGLSACSFATTNPLPDLTDTGLFIKTVEITGEPLGKEKIEAIRRKLQGIFSEEWIQQTFTDPKYYLNYVTRNSDIAQQLFVAVECGDYITQRTLLDPNYRHYPRTKILH